MNKTVGPQGWRNYLPHLRVLEEDLYEDSESEDQVDLEIVEESDVDKVKKLSKQTDTSDIITLETNEGVQSLTKGMAYEVRDESGRKWYSFFNEYEYRFNKAYKNKRKHWYNFLYPNYDNQLPAERSLLMKLDLVIGVYFLLLCWSKSVDASNFTSAYVSGLKEDLDLKGNDYIYTQTIANVGSIIFQIPFMYLLPRYPAHLILPVMDFGWSWFTFACYRAKSLAEIRAYRFILNAFGAAYYPVSQYILGCWYAPDEISSRVCLFYCGQLLGAITSGLLQSRIYKSLNGVHGLAGWRWMFLIDAVAISIPTAIIGFFVIPGIPSKCYSLFLTDEEIRIARLRNKKNHIKDGVSKDQLQNMWSWKTWKKVFFTSTFWVLVVFDTCSWNNFGATGGSYSLWLKSNPNYSIPKVNQLSAVPAALGIGFVLFCSLGSDLLRCKWVFMVFAAIMNCVSCGLLVKWDLRPSTKWYAFLTTYFSVAASPCLWSFINDFLRLDPQIKAITWISIYSVSQSTYAWIPTLVWPTVDAPRFKKGYISSVVFGAIYGLWTFVVLYFYKRNEKRRAIGNGIILYDSSKNESPPKYVENMEEIDGFYYVKDKSI